MVCIHFASHSYSHCSLVLALPLLALSGRFVFVLSFLCRCLLCFACAFVSSSCPFVCCPLAFALNIINSQQLDEGRFSQNIKHKGLYISIILLVYWTGPRVSATAVSWRLQPSCDPPGRCHCCFLASCSAPAALLQRSCSAPAALLQRSWTLQPVFWPLPCSCNAPGRCRCCCLASGTLLQSSWTLPLLLPSLCNVPAVLLDAATAASGPATLLRRS